MLEIGLVGELTYHSTIDNTAKTLRSGTLNVFATPAMVALIEETCWKSVDPYMNLNECTVGISLNIEHLSPTPVGMTICCHSKLTKIEGRKLIFEVEVFDEVNLIGRGTHSRFIVDSEKFQSKTDSKISKATR